MDEQDGALTRPTPWAGGVLGGRHLIVYILEISVERHRLVYHF
ncbi:hypothetical protein [Microbacterium sp.]|nr:hypothetical protein [Microbacterium sp.]